tara:strand:+ start:83 stop:388 length:306 start_codon:yes stop_codon:yes gene_type:complete
MKIKYVKPRKLVTTKPFIFKSILFLVLIKYAINSNVNKPVINKGRAGKVVDLKISKVKTREYSLFIKNTLYAYRAYVLRIEVLVMEAGQNMKTNKNGTNKK